MKRAIFILFILIVILGCTDGKPETGPLSFSIVSPSSNETLDGNFFLELKGKSSSPIKSVSLLINDRTKINLPVGSDLKKPNKKWKILINKLKKGYNVLAVTVKNAKNEVAVKSVRVKRVIPDPNAIFVKILNPTKNQEIKKDFTLSIKVKSKKAVVSYWIKHAGTRNVWKKLPMKSILKWNLKIKDFKSGEQFIYVTAYNGVKYAPTVKVKVKIDKPLPVAQTIKIKILYPTKNKTLTKDFKLKLKIDSKLPIKNIWIKHKATNNRWKALKINGTKYEWLLKIATFDSGNNELNVSAYNGKEYGYAKVKIKIKRNVPVDKGPGFGNCYVHAGDFGGAGKKPGKFRKPYYIQVSNARKVFVTDSTLNRVSVFNHKGKFLFSFGKQGSGAGQFDNPVGICIYKNNKIFVSDYYNRRVGIFSIKGKFIKFFYGKGIREDNRFKLTGGVAVNDIGELFVVDFDGHKVFKFDTNGNFKFTFGSKGSGPGQLNNPTGITISLDGFIYVTDKKNDRIVVFERNGKYSFDFGRTGSGRGGFARPMGIAVDKFNHIYVSDTRNNRILKFNHKGKFLCIVAKNVVNPIGVAIDNSTGVVYVADRDASVVRMYKPCPRNNNNRSR